MGVKTAGLPQFAADGESVFFGEHDVEDDDVIGIEPGQVHGLLAVAADVDGVLLFLEPFLQESADFPVILDDQDSHGLALIHSPILVAGLPPKALPNRGLTTLLKIEPKV